MDLELKKRLGASRPVRGLKWFFRDGDVSPIPFILAGFGFALAWRIYLAIQMSLIPNPFAAWV